MSGKTYTEAEIIAAVERVATVARDRATQARADADAKEGPEKVPFLMDAHGWTSRANGAVSVLKEIGIYD